MPPVSLIKKIYHRSKFRSIATDWGNENENNVRHKYCEYMSKSHVNHSVNLSGLILNPDFPYLGASPDGIVNCPRCGVGCLEIKFPSKYRYNLIEDMILGSCGYPEFGNGGAVEIVKTHAYYYQIQTQLLVTQYDYCDLFAMLINDFVCIRIKLDKNYLRKSQENENFSLRKPYYQNFWQIFLASQPSLMQEVLEKCVIVT